MNKNGIEQVDQFIEDLRHDQKPRAYRREKVDPQMEKMYESIRAVKRLGRGRTAKGGLFKSRWIKGIAALAAALLLAAGVMVMNFPFCGETNIVHAVARAYEELQSYSGRVEIRTERNGAIESREIIEIKYKKPYQYFADHKDGSSETRHISDGEKLAVIKPGAITIDNIFPERELWRYHLGRSVRELEYAVEVNTLGAETLFGRKATLLEYRYAGDELYQQMWIDEATKLPLRKVLNHPEGSKLVVEFIELEINPQLEDDIFTWSVPPGVKIRELNRSADMEEIKRAWPEVAGLLSALPEGMKLERAGVLDADLYEYVLRFQGVDKDDYLDVYYTADSPQFSFLFRPEIELGRLAGGYVDFDSHAWNIFGRQEENRVARWIGEGGDLFIVSGPGRKVDELLSIMERWRGEKIEYGLPLQENTLDLYFMEITDTAFKLNKEERAFEKQPEASELMEELLKGPRDKGLSRVIPEGTRLLELRVENGITYVDLSAEIAGANYGAEAEGVLIDSIVWTMTQLEEIEAVQILVEGEIVDSLGGHYSASIPLTR